MPIEPFEKRRAARSGMEAILVAVTIRAVPGSALRAEFDAFLFASIGEDGNGMQVSVLSGLARSDLDPWQEAAKLAELPGKTAVDRLTALIETLPGNAWARPDARAVATRLIALLPRTPAGNPASGPTPDNLGAMIKSRPWWVYVLLMTFVLGSQILVASQQPSPAAHLPAVNATGEVAPPQPPAFSGQ
jgi:hypothetical protein